MKLRYTILVGLMAISAACEKGSVTYKEGQPIYLAASLPNNSQTKVPYDQASPSQEKPLVVDVWASTTRNEFINNGYDGRTKGEGEVAIYTEGNFQSGTPQLLSQAVYPPPRKGSSGNWTADPVYFVAMHPQSKDGHSWITPDDGNKGKQAIFTFTGCEDLMFAPEVSGAYDTEDQDEVVKNSPILKFEHLLTRFTVKMYIELEEGENLLDVQEAWGKITDISIKSYNDDYTYTENLNKVTIDLTKGDSFSYDTDIKFSGSTDGAMEFYGIGTDASFPGTGGYTLTLQKDSLAYVMCAPVIATNVDNTNEYYVTVETENRGTVELNLDLKESNSEKYSESTRGKHFGIKIIFKKGSAIATVADILQWENGGIGIGDITDD